MASVRPVRLKEHTTCVNCNQGIPAGFPVWNRHTELYQAWHAGKLEMLCIAVSGHLMRWHDDNARRTTATPDERERYRLRASGLRFDINPDPETSVTVNLTKPEPIKVGDAASSLLEYCMAQVAHKLDLDRAAEELELLKLLDGLSNATNQKYDKITNTTVFPWTDSKRYGFGIQREAKFLGYSYAGIDRNAPVQSLEPQLPVPTYTACGQCMRTLLSGHGCINPACLGDPAKIAEASQLADTRCNGVSPDANDRAAWAHALRTRIDAATKQRALEEHARLGWDPYGDD